MEGEKLRDYLKRKGIKVSDAADSAGMSRSAFHSLLNKAVINEAQQKELVATLSLPGNFFSGAVQMAGDNATQTQTVQVLDDCKRDLAVARETVRQLEIRIKEKDSIINNLLKSQSSRK